MASPALAHRTACGGRRLDEIARRSTRWDVCAGPGCDLQILTGGRNRSWGADGRARFCCDSCRLREWRRAKKEAK
jgi:hypothetical protein